MKHVPVLTAIAVLVFFIVWSVLGLVWIADNTEWFD